MENPGEFPLVSPEASFATACKARAHAMVMYILSGQAPSTICSVEVPAGGREAVK
jgi:hypothetical protein